MKHIICALLCVSMLIPCTIYVFSKHDMGTSDIVGILTIFSSEGERAHSFISVYNTSEDPLEVGHITVESGTECTFGTWRSLNTSMEGLWYNMEALNVNYKKDGSTYVSLSVPITLDDVNTITSILNSCDVWAPTVNSAVFATYVWNKVSPVTIPYGLFPNPKTLKGVLIGYDQHEINRHIEEPTLVGYVTSARKLYYWEGYGDLRKQDSPICLW